MKEHRHSRFSIAIVTVLVVCATVGLVTQATPVFNIETAADWNLPEISPLPEGTWADYMAKIENDGFYPDDPYTVTPTTLYVYEGAGFPGLEGEDAGLIMTWGDTTDTNTNYASAWQYVYPKDPNLIGTTLLCSVLPPQLGGTGQVNSVGVGLVDAAGLIRSWRWNCSNTAAPNTILWNQMWNLSMGPIGPAIPPGPPGGGPASATNAGGTAVLPIFFNAPGFNPATVQSIIAIESGQMVGTWPAPPANGIGGPIPLVWNFWGRLGVVPEPASAALLALGIVGLLSRRRRP